MGEQQWAPGAYTNEQVRIACRILASCTNRVVAKEKVMAGLYSAPSLEQGIAKALRNGEVVWGCYDLLGASQLRDVLECASCI